jgi:hypothetical protein
MVSQQQATIPVIESEEEALEIAEMRTPKTRSFSKNQH